MRNRMLVTGLAAMLLLGPASAHAATNFTSDLTLGSSGTSVTDLQNWLIGKGFSIPAGATGYFGGQTQAALAAYQTAQGIIPASGYFGPLTRANINARVSDTTTPNTPSEKSSAEGYLDRFTQLSKFSNESVGENDSVEVLGTSFRAEDADQTINRVTVTIGTPSNGSGSTVLSKYIKNVSVLLDGEEIGTLSVNSSSKSGNKNSLVHTFRFTGLDGVVKKGKTAELTIAVEAVNSIDSLNTYDWTVTLPDNAIRAVSPNKADDTYGSLIETTFSVEKFASANNVELKVSKNDESPVALATVAASGRTTKNVELLRFDMKAKGSTIVVDELPITFSVTGATDVDSVTSKVSLKIGKKTYSESVSTSAASATVIFDNLNLTIDEDETVEVTVLADVNKFGSDFIEGSTLKAELTPTNLVALGAEDKMGDDLSSSDKVGSALGDTIAFYDTGITTEFVSAEQSTQHVDGAANDTGTFTIKYRVTAFGGPVYLSTSPLATIADTVDGASGLLYRTDLAGTATADEVSGVVTHRSVKGGKVTESTNGVRLNEGATAEFTLTIIRTNNGTGAGLYRTVLKSIGWNKDDSTNWNAYNFNLQDYKTDYTFLN